MSAIEPAGEKIVRNLQQAVERLQEDIARVELWAGALGCFSEPIPEYDHGQTNFDLPPAKASVPPDEKPGHRTVADRIGSPHTKRREH